MINFALFLITVCALGFIVLFVQDKLKKCTLPQADNMTIQLAGESVAVTMEERERYSTPVKNSHWFIHTFMRPRRKVK